MGVLNESGLGLLALSVLSIRGAVDIPISRYPALILRGVALNKTQQFQLQLSLACHGDRKPAFSQLQLRRSPSRRPVVSFSCH